MLLASSNVSCTVLFCVLCTVYYALCAMHHAAFAKCNVDLSQAPLSLFPYCDCFFSHSSGVKHLGVQA